MVRFFVLQVYNLKTMSIESVPSMWRTAVQAQIDLLKAQSV